MSRPLLAGAVRAAAPLYAGLAVTFAAGFALKALLVAHVFAGPADMARFETLDRALQGLVVVAMLGMPAAVLRLAPARPDAQGRLVRAAAAVSVAAAAAGWAAILFVPPVRAAVLGEGSRLPFAVYGLRALTIPAAAVGSALLHARGRLGRRAFLDAAERVAALAAVAVCAAALPGRGVLAAALGCLLASVAALVLVVPSVPDVLRRGTAAPPGAFRDDVRALLAVGRPGLAVAVLEALRPLALIRVAAEVAGPRDAGLVATAAAFTLPLIAVPEMASQALFPAMSGPEGERPHVEEDRRRLLREMLVAGVPLLAAFGAAAAWLLPLPKGGLYADAVPAVLALLPGVLAHGAAAHAGYVLLIRDRLRAHALVSALALVATALAAAWAVPRWGATGGAAALSAALVLRGALLVALSRRPA